MTLFDIIGPVMIGPSSSHTAGAVRLGLMARNVLGCQPEKADIYLHGSFRCTYRGHGTDRALVGGLLGYPTDDTRIRDSFRHAADSNLQYRFIPADLGDVHPNTVKFELTGQGRQCTVVGCSVGGGAVEVTNINGYKVKLTGELPALVVPHIDRAGYIAKVSGILGAEEINIAAMHVGRNQRGGTALMIIETDQMIDSVLLQVIDRIPGVSGSFVIAPL
ncbi:MAG: L-serine ammonia-lyase, iron-sulfur-dependent subunit beta [Negativicutes bacterium]|nr:L-serine ammonia-lyase, iron-sulfur-dependent subunit beta [Negativicutes bacterium]